MPKRPSNFQKVGLFLIGHFRFCLKTLTTSSISDAPNPIHPTSLHHFIDWKVIFIFQKKIKKFSNFRNKLWSSPIWKISPFSHFSESFHFEGNVIINSYWMPLLYVNHYCSTWFASIVLHLSTSLTANNL